MGRDQHLNVQRVEATGVGSGISALASPDEIATAVERVLRDRGFAAAARHEAAISAQEGGPSAAAAHVIALGS